MLIYFLSLCFVAVRRRTSLCFVVMHRFTYVSGTSVSAGDFKELRTNVFGVSSVNQNSGLCK